MTHSQQGARKVAVIGAGMGGLAVAIALRKIGLEVRVFEQSSQFSAVGICLSVFPNGQRALAALSSHISERIRERGHELPSLCIRKPSGEVIAEKPHDFEARFGLPLLVIRWSSLQEVLRDELPRGVIGLGQRAIELRESDHGIEVASAAGHVETFDLAVAADGIHSRFRARILEDQPLYAGRVSCRAVIPAPADIDVPEGVMIDQTSGQTFAAGPVGEGHVFWNAMVQGPAEQADLQGESARAFVLARYENFAASALALVRATPAAEVLVRPILTRAPLPVMHKGRLVVLGDAAHAMQLSSGQGANLSFEDAFELAQCLATHMSWADALETFSARRVPRVQVVHARNAFVSNKAHSADAHDFMKGVVERAQLNEAEFQQYLHSYVPAGGWQL